jgi:hypothetical protein
MTVYLKLVPPVSHATGESSRSGANLDLLQLLSETAIALEVLDRPLDVL